VTWCWFALSDHEVDGAWASASAGDRWLQAWPCGRKPVAHAVRADARAFDPAGETATVSLLLLEAERSPLYDDPTVRGALRQVLGGPPPAAVTTFVRDGVHFAGALVAWRGGVGGDPFRGLGVGELLEVGPGLIGAAGGPPGPVTQRYAEQPWPAAGF
jgi:hypothetical protein